MITISIQSSSLLKKDEDVSLTSSLIRNENNPNRPFVKLELEDKKTGSKVHITLNKYEAKNLSRGLRALSMEM